MQTLPTAADRQSIEPRIGERNFDVGALHSDIWLTLQTRHAQHLVRGRSINGKPPITGLMGFADRLRLIWQAAQDDDPYAEWWLLKIHDGLEVADARIAERRKVMQSTLSRALALRIAPAAAKEPFRVQLRFATPYAFQAARILYEFDRLVCEAFTAKHVGILGPRQCAEAIRSCARKVRSVFDAPKRYRRLGIDRAAIRGKDAILQRAELLMGALPEDVLSGARRAPLLDRYLGPDPVPAVIDVEDSLLD